MNQSCFSLVQHNITFLYAISSESVKLGHIVKCFTRDAGGQLSRGLAGVHQVTACLKFIERFSNPDLKADIICDHQDNTPEGTVGVSTAAQVGVASEVPDTKAHIHTPDMSRFQRKS